MKVAPVAIELVNESIIGFCILSLYKTSNSVMLFWLNTPKNSVQSNTSFWLSMIPVSVLISINRKSSFSSLTKSAEKKVPFIILIL